MFNCRSKFPFRNDRESWKGLKQGNTEALGYLYDKYVDDLFAIGYSIYPDKNLIEDAIHDTFIELFKYHEKLSDVDNVKAYLIISFKRGLLKKKKSKEVLFDSNSLETKLSLSEYSESHENKVIKLEQSSFNYTKLKHATNSLTPYQIKVLDLKFTKDKSYEEIAKDLNISVSSVRTLIYRTIKILRKKTLFFL